MNKLFNLSVIKTLRECILLYVHAMYLSLASHHALLYPFSNRNVHNVRDLTLRRSVESYVTQCMNEPYIIVRGTSMT